MSAPQKSIITSHKMHRRNDITRKKHQNCLRVSETKDLFQMILEAVQGLLAKLARENKEEKLKLQTKNLR